MAISTDGSTQTASRTISVTKVQQGLNYFGANLVVDGVVGLKTQKALDQYVRTQTTIRSYSMVPYEDRRSVELTPLFLATALEAAAGQYARRSPAQAEPVPGAEGQTSSADPVLLLPGSTGPVTSSTWVWWLVGAGALAGVIYLVATSSKKPARARARARA